MLRTRAARNHHDENAPWSSIFGYATVAVFSYQIWLRQEACPQYQVTCHVIRHVIIPRSCHMLAYSLARTSREPRQCARLESQGKHRSHNLQNPDNLTQGYSMCLGKFGSTTYSTSRAQTPLSGQCWAPLPGVLHSPSSPNI